ncbi:MAG: hypothetical protein WA944_02455 [Mycobacterium sp.]
MATPGGTEIDRVAAPKSLTAAQGQLRALQRRAARQQGPYDPQAQTRREPSKRWRRTRPGSAAHTPTPRSYAATCCTRPPPHWPNNTR